MLASILVAVRNGEAYLAAALDSVVAAAEANPYEIVIQDAESTDGTQRIATSHPARIRYFRESDDGQSDGLNRALGRSEGDFVGWFNADDLYLPGAISAAAAIFEADPSVDVVFGDWNVVGSESNLLREHHVGAWEWKELYRKGNYVFTGATFFRRTVFERFGVFSTELDYVADLEYFLRVGADVRAVHAGRALGAFRYHHESKSGSKRFHFCTEAAAVRRRFLNAPGAGYNAYVRAQAVLWLSASIAPLRYTKPYSAMRRRLSAWQFRSVQDRQADWRSRRR